MIVESKLPAYYKQDGVKRVNVQAAALIEAHGGVVLPYRDLPAEAQMALAQYMAIDGEAWERADVLVEEIHRRCREHRREGQDDVLTAGWEGVFRAALPFYVELYGDWEFGIVEIPTVVLVKEVMTRNQDMQDWGGDWEGYHGWYKSEGYKHTATGSKPWPVILGSFPDEVLEDGWNRFHQYVERGLPTIPAVWFPGEKN